tara:strand:- start:1041 stop:2075 length:1035 start_codon:yes stop_codon:yes gene_type:complete
MLIITNISLSIIISILTLLVAKNFFLIGLDEKIGTQKIHKKTAVRVGGLSIVSTILIVNVFIDKNANDFLIPFLIVSLFFLIGFYEDITRSLSSVRRLILSIIAASALIFFTSTTLNEADLKIINNLLSYPLIAFLVSILGVSITSNAWNFIDGLNGLASGMASVTLLAFSFIALQNDIIIFSNILFSLSLIVFGFFLVNIFSGQIFLGDGGSYFIGALVAWSGLKLVNLEPLISAWGIFLIIIYPATEFTFSFLRRIIFGKSPLIADSKHLHSLIYNYISSAKKSKLKNISNSISGLIIILYGSIPAIISCMIGNDFNKIIITIIAFIFTYILIYIFLSKKKN